MDSFRNLPLRFYIDLLIDVLFASKTVLSFQLLFAMKLSGVSDSVKTNGEAAIPSSPAKPVAQTGNSSRDDNPIKSKCATAGSKSPIKPIGKTGASSSLNIGVRGKASVSSGSKGKAIVSDNVGEVVYLQRRDIRAPWRRGTVSVDPLLGGLECSDEGAYRPRNASHRWRGINRDLFYKISLENCLVEMLWYHNTCLLIIAYTVKKTKLV